MPMPHYCRTHHPKPVSFLQKPFDPHFTPTSADKRCCVYMLSSDLRGWGGPPSQGPGLLVCIITVLTIHAATGEARAPVSLCPPYRPQASQRGL